MNRSTAFFFLYSCFALLNSVFTLDVFAERHEVNTKIEIIGVTSLSGLISSTEQIQLLSSLQTNKVYREVSSGSLKFSAKTLDGVIHEGYITTFKIDHSTSQGFELIIPSEEPIQSLTVFRTSDNQELFNQTFDTSLSAGLIVSVDRISVNEWKIPASNQGRRIVRRLEPRNKVLIFDLDKEDKIIEGVEGEMIEIQYQTSAGRVKKLLIKLQ